MAIARSKNAGDLPDQITLLELIQALSEFEVTLRRPRGLGLLAFPPDSLSMFDLYRLGDASAIAEREAAERVHERWDKLLKRPALAALLQSPHFAGALDSFRKQIKPNLVHEVQFLLRSIINIVLYIGERQRPETIRQPDARTRSQAASAVRRLRQLAKKGARLEGLEDRHRLEALLDSLLAQMDKKPEKRPRNDKTQAERLFVKRLATDFLLMFGQPLTTAVSCLGGVIGYSADDRNIERVVKNARREYEKGKINGLVEALRAHKSR